MEPRPKDPRTVDIPRRLRKFLTRCAKQIAAGKEETTIESDDLLQCSFCEGGLLEAGGDRFSFEYTVGDDDGPRWQFELSAADIAEIAAGRRTSIDMFACKDPKCGAMFSSPEAGCVNCDLPPRPRADEPKLPEGPFESRFDWVRKFVAANPGWFDGSRGSASFLVITNYNGTGLGQSLGWFAGADAEEAVRVALLDEAGN